MAQVDVYSQDKKKLASAVLGEGWAKSISRNSVFTAALWQMSGRRAGTSAVKERSEVQGSGRKIYRQKGTGQARHGDRQANIFVGGGIAGGPRARDWSYSIPKKQRRRAIQSALIYKLRQEKILVVDNLEFGEIKTKKAKEFFRKWDLKSALLVLDQASENVVKSVRNLPGFKTCSVSSLNVGDVIGFEHLVVTKAALGAIEKQWL
jgi:large subunit ribosomal protein L4